MPYYAHEVVEVGNKRYDLGDVIPEDLPGLDEILEHGTAVHPEPYTRQVTVDAQGRVQGEAHVEAFAGDFTSEQIADPEVDTPSLGSPGDPAQVEHAATHSAANDEGQVSA